MLFHIEHFDSVLFIYCQITISPQTITHTYYHSFHGSRVGHRLTGSSVSGSHKVVVKMLASGKNLPSSSSGGW